MAPFRTAEPAALPSMLLQRSIFAEMKTIHYFHRASLGLALLLLVSCSAPHPGADDRAHRPNIIFDTDIGSDCDDAGAMAVLHKLADRGEINIVGIISSSGRNRYGVGVCDAINTYYGRGSLALGQYKNDDVGDPKNWFSKEIATATTTYRHDVVDSGKELVAAYTALLRKQRDGSVTIVRLIHLMRAPAGLELIERKVKRCVSMAYCGDRPYRDWNFGRNGAESYTREFLMGA